MQNRIRPLADARGSHREASWVNALRRPTIKDVAKAAGVTYPTVSRVLSNKPYVATDTRERVMRAIESLGYRPSAAARSMVLNRTHTLAMLVPHLADPNFGTFFIGAEREARAHGYSVLVADHESITGRDHLLTEHRVDGLLLLESYRFGPELEGLDVPIVHLDDAPMDQRGGGRLVGRHLKELGHDKVVLIGGPADAPHATLRYGGLLEIYPNAPWLPGDWTAETGYALLGPALETGATAIFAANDFIALGSMRATRERGLEIPRDLSIVGFDDSPLAQHFHPSLTTVRQPIEVQGAHAASLLIARLSGQNAPSAPPHPLELIVRDSSGPAPGSLISGRAIFTHTSPMHSKDSTGPPRKRHTD